MPAARLTLPGIPESIPRKVVIDILTVAGLDIDDLISFEVTRAGIQAEVYACDQYGRRYANGTDEDGHTVVATHSIHIRFDDDTSAVDGIFVRDPA